MMIPTFLPRPRARRPWTVLLLGGASGVGKSSVSYRLAHHFGAGITEVDDFQVTLQRCTTPDQMPALHRWEQDEEFRNAPPECIAEHIMAVGREMAPGLIEIINNHLTAAAPVVLEGDFLLPELLLHPDLVHATQSGLLRAVFLQETRVEQLVTNYFEREPEAGDQRTRALVSMHHGAWLERTCNEMNVPILHARPWQTLLARLISECAEDPLPIYPPTGHSFAHDHGLQHTGHERDAGPLNEHG